MRGAGKFSPILLRGPESTVSPLPSTSLSLGALSLEGASAAGEETWFRLQPPGLALDVGRGMPQLVGLSEIFLSHGHLDHALGLPFVLSQRGMHHRKHQGAPVRVFCPAPIAARLEALVSAAEALEETRYAFSVTGLAPAERVGLTRGFTLEAFATDHVVPSLGAHLFATRRHLREPFRGLSQERLVELKRAGEAIEEESEEHLLSYCGDTGPGVFTLSPRLFEAEVLMIECTFLGPELVGRSSEYGHLHLEDLVRVRHRFENRLIVLYHLSRRHRAEELRQAVDQELPELAERIIVWGERR